MTSYKHLHFVSKISNPNQFFVDLLDYLGDSYELYVSDTPNSQHPCGAYLGYGEMELNYAVPDHPNRHFPKYGMYMQTTLTLLCHTNGTEQWAKLVAYVLKTTTLDLVEGDLPILIRKSNIVYDGWEDTKYYSDLIPIKTKGINDLQKWKPDYYINQSHQIFVTSSFENKDRIHHHILDLLRIDNLPLKASDMTILSFPASDITLRQLDIHDFRVKKLIIPNYLIDLTPHSADAYIRLLHVINQLIKLNTNFIFAWKNVPLLVCKEGKVFSTHALNSFIERYNKVLQFEIDGLI